MNSTGRGWMISIILLCCIFASNGIVYASGSLVEDSEIDSSHVWLSVTDNEETIHAASKTSNHGDTVAYHGSSHSFSVFYHPVLLAGTLLGVAILFVVGFYLIRRGREGENK